MSLWCLFQLVCVNTAFPQHTAYIISFKRVFNFWNLSEHALWKVQKSERRCWLGHVECMIQRWHTMQAFLSFCFKSFVMLAYVHAHRHTNTLMSSYSEMHKFCQRPNTVPISRAREHVRTESWAVGWVEIELIPRSYGLTGFYRFKQWGKHDLVTGFRKWQKNKNSKAMKDYTYCQYCLLCQNLWYTQVIIRGSNPGKICTPMSSWSLKPMVPSLPFSRIELILIKGSFRRGFCWIWPAILRSTLTKKDIQLPKSLVQEVDKFYLHRKS